MKKFVITVAVLLFAGSVKSQTVTPASTITPGGGRDKTLAAPTDRTSVAPPEHITTQFNTDYPGKNEVSWRPEGKNFVVTYKDPKTGMSNMLVYDADGKIIRKESEVDKEIYPSGINDYYTKEYPKESYKVWQTEKQNGKTYYYINRKGKTIWFDQTGKNIANPD
jgi:hypothetical protein